MGLPDLGFVAGVVAVVVGGGGDGGFVVVAVVVVIGLGYVQAHLLLYLPSLFSLYLCLSILTSSVM